MPEELIAMGIADDATHGHAGESGIPLTGASLVFVTEIEQALAYDLAVTCPLDVILRRCQIDMDFYSNDRVHLDELLAVVGIVANPAVADPLIAHDEVVRFSRIPDHQPFSAMRPDPDPRLVSVTDQNEATVLDDVDDLVELVFENNGRSGSTAKPSTLEPSALPLAEILSFYSSRDPEEEPIPERAPTSAAVSRPVAQPATPPFTPHAPPVSPQAVEPIVPPKPASGSGSNPGPDPEPDPRHVVGDRTDEGFPETKLAQPGSSYVPAQVAEPTTTTSRADESIAAPAPPVHPAPRRQMRPNWASPRALLAVGAARQSAPAPDRHLDASELRRYILAYHDRLAVTADLKFPKIAFPIPGSLDRIDLLFRARNTNDYVVRQIAPGKGNSDHIRLLLKRLEAMEKVIAGQGLGLRGILISQFADAGLADELRRSVAGWRYEVAWMSVEDPQPEGTHL